jgi:hypothetical protein
MSDRELKVTESKAREVLKRGFFNSSIDDVMLSLFGEQMDEWEDFGKYTGGPFGIYGSYFRIYDGRIWRKK